MSTIRGVKNRQYKFTQILNIMLDDSNLSLKAKGFITYCLSKTEAWVFRICHLVDVLKEGEKAIYSVIDECIQNGYAIRFQIREASGLFGTWETVISDSKEEIDLLKEEMKKDPELKERLPHRHFGDAVKGDSEKVPPSNMEASVRNMDKLQPIAPTGIVVYEILEKLDIELPLRVKISSSHSEEDVILAVNRCLNWKGRNSDQQGIMTALARKETWFDVPTKQQQEESNAEFLKKLSSLDGKRIGNTNVVVGLKYIEFTAGMKQTTFSIDQEGFKKSVNEYIQYLDELLKYQESKE